VSFADMGQIPHCNRGQLRSDGVVLGPTTAAPLQLPSFCRSRTVKLTERLGGANPTMMLITAALGTAGRLAGVQSGHTICTLIR
jgi:hypothetical protein